MDDGEYRVTMIRIRIGVVIFNAIVRRLPAAANYLDDGRSVCVLGYKSIHSQRDTFRFVVDDIPNARGLR